MTLRIIVECHMCHTRYILKCQRDYSMNEGDAPIRIGCKNCGHTIRGKIGISGIIFDEDRFIDDNLLMNEADCIGISAELPIVKDLFYFKTQIFSSGPYMALLPSFTFEQIGTHSIRIKYLVNFSTHELVKLKNIYSVAKRGNADAFNTYAKKEFGMSEGSEVNSIDMYTDVLAILGQVFKIIVSLEYHNIFTQTSILPIINAIKSSSTVKLENLRMEIEENVSLEDEFTKGLDLCFSFLDKLTSFYPVMLLLNMDDFSKEFKDKCYLSTTEYDDVKHLFAENFEFLSRMSVLFVGIDNMKERSDYDAFPMSPLSWNLAKYRDLDNGQKNKILVNFPVLDKYFARTLDNQIRNGINHEKIQYDSVSQIITYNPFIKRPKDSKDIALIDFCFIILQQSIKVYESICVLDAFLRKTR